MALVTSTAVVFPTESAEAAPPETYRDEFGAISYSGNDGTLNWTGDWIEVGESNGPTRGRVRVRSSSRCVASSNCLSIGADQRKINGRGAYREADLLGATSAALSFMFDERGESVGVDVEVSGDGGASWTTLELITSGTPAGLKTYDITAYAAVDTQIRFIGVAGTTDEDSYLYFDDIEISADLSTTKVSDKDIPEPEPFPESSPTPVLPSIIRANVGMEAEKISLPMVFEQNVGQVDDEVDFFARGHGYSVFLSGSDALLALGNGESGFAVRMSLVGARDRPEAVAHNRQPGQVNYFIGDDPAGWQTGVSTFAAIEYRDVFPGIDLRYYGNNLRLEYDFIVHPGADPSAIGLGFEGATSLRVTEAGEMEIGLNPGRSVTFSAPVSYQMIDGQRVPVESAYLLDGTEVGFIIGDYDISLPLVIDPVLQYSTYLGGADLDYLYDVAGDSTGASYVVGGAKVGYPTTTGAYQESAVGGFDVVVTKVAPDGQSLLYSTFIGGGSDDTGYAITVDAAGNAFITGETGSDDYPTPGAPFDGTRNGLDAFVTKVSADGSALLYSTFLGGTDSEVGNGIAIDGSGNAYVVGQTLSSDFPLQNAYDGTLSGSTDAFVTKVNSGGTGLVYSTYVGGSGLEDANAIVLGASDEAWVTGYTASTDFPTTANTYKPSRADSSRDVFVLQFNAAGSAISYGTYLGGTSEDEGYGIDLNPSGNVYVTGIAQSTFPATAGAWDTTLSSGDEIFVAKFDPSLIDAAELIYSGFIGGLGNDRGTDVAVGSSGQAYVSGYVNSTGLATGDGYDQTQNGQDGLMAIISFDGSAKVYATYLGGTLNEFAHGIALESGKIHVTGYTNSTDFPLINEYDATAGSEEGWLVRFIFVNEDSDGDGLWDFEEDANTDLDANPATNPGPDTDGDTFPNYLDADDDGDSVATSAENADPNGDGDPRDAVDSDRDGQPDYLDVPTGASDGTVDTEQKISDTAGGLAAILNQDDKFGVAVVGIGDVDGDGINDV